MCIISFASSFCTSAPGSSIHAASSVAALECTVHPLFHPLKPFAGCPSWPGAQGLSLSFPSSPTIMHLCPTHAELAQSFPTPGLQGVLCLGPSGLLVDFWSSFNALLKRTYPGSPSRASGGPLAPCSSSCFSLNSVPLNLSRLVPRVSPPEGYASVQGHFLICVSLAFSPSLSSTHACESTQ